jgi:hypothetical protein
VYPRLLLVYTRTYKASEPPPGLRIPVSNPVTYYLQLATTMPPHGFGEGDAAGPTTILCSACQKINVANLMRKLISVPDWWAQRNNMPKLDGMVHVDARQLPLSATNCSLCRLILDAVLEENHHVDDLEHRLTDSPIYLRPSTPRRGTLPVFPGDEVAGASYVFGFRAFVPIQGGLVLGHIKLFALPGTCILHRLVMSSGSAKAVMSSVKRSSWQQLLITHLAQSCSVGL